MQTVFVGLSGGVDSAVSAALLKERGFNVVGAFIKIWRPEFIECTWKEDRQDAMRVAAALGIPFREIDLSEEYKREIVDSMVADYAKGITPNPDVLCNRYIKFGSFFRWARENGADFVATGHYARVVEQNGTFELHRGADREKDQSYFLHQISAEDLPHIIFPVGDMQKSEVRTAATHFGLPVAKRPDSQGLCFLGDVSMSEFLSRFMKVEQGDILDMEGKIVGKHGGAALYTIGQRHGFSVRLLALSLSKGSVPHYVVAVDTKTNTIRVSPHREDAAIKSVKMCDMHWLQKPIDPLRLRSGQVAQGKPLLPAEVFAQARYRETPIKVSISEVNDVYTVTFSVPHIAAPGQSLVLYEGEKCLGGGTIIL